MRALALSMSLYVGGATLPAVEYTHDIQPLMQQMCVTCHGPTKHKGGLRLDSLDAMRAGGKSGPGIVPGDPTNSPIYRRVILPADHPDIMPAQGAVLTVDQQQMLLAWIAAGAPDGPAAVTHPTAEPPASTPMAKVTDTRTALPAIPDTDLDLWAAAVSPPSPHALESLRGLGIWYRSLSRNGAALDVDVRQLKGPLDDRLWTTLSALAPNVVWFDAEGSGLVDRDMSHMAKLTQLTRLHLEHTAVTDRGLSALTALSHLHYLNLVQTTVSDASIPTLSHMTSLESLYLWQTAVSQEGAARLATALPGTTIVLTPHMPDPPVGDAGDHRHGKANKK